MEAIEKLGNLIEQYNVAKQVGSGQPTSIEAAMKFDPELESNVKALLEPLSELTPEERDELRKMEYGSEILVLLEWNSLDKM